MMTESIAELLPITTVSSELIKNLNQTDAQNTTLSEIAEVVSTTKLSTTTMVAESITNASVTTTVEATTAEIVMEEHISVDWTETGLDPSILDTLYTYAGWQLAIAIVTILFAAVISIYGPYVFGSQALVNGMNVATDCLEFFLPVRYSGRPADEKMDGYSHEAYVSKIRRFAGFIAFTMIAFAFLEMVTGAVGRSALKDHSLGEGSLMLFDAHVTLCVFCGLTSFGLLVSCFILFRKRFLPEMMIVYGMRNMIVLCLFTASWMRALQFDDTLSEQANAFREGINELQNKTSALVNSI